MDELDGKVAVITGAGSGIGAGVARACAAAGMSVVVVDLDPERASAVSKELAALGCRTAAIVADVSDEVAMVELAEEVFDRFGGCHFLHNNAGVCPLGRSWEHSTAEWHRVLGVNLMGVVHAVNTFVPRLIEQGEEAHIVNTASAAALRYVPASCLYNATKFGVLALSESLRRDLEPHSIGVSALCPGGVATNIGDSMRGMVGSQRSDEQVNSLLAELASVDEKHMTVITPEQVGMLVLEGVGNNAAYIITHPGSYPAVAERHAGIQAAYVTARSAHSELP